MSQTALSGAEFKKQLRDSIPKMGLFLNSHSPTLAEQLAHSGYDWLLVDTQHGPMGNEQLSAMLAAVGSSGAKSLVRVAGYHDRGGIQQALDLGSDGVLIPYINSAEEARQAVSCARYPTQGTRSVYFPQRSTNKDGLLGYVGNANKNVIVALQVETASCIRNMAEIAAVPGVDILFLGQNDLCMSMGLVRKVRVPRDVHFARARPGNADAGRRGTQEQCDPGSLPVRHFARGRISRQRIHVHQHRQRSAPRAHAVRRVCEGYGDHRAGRGKELVAAADGFVLAAGTPIHRV